MPEIHRHILQLVACPDVELPLFPLTICVLRGIECARGSCHFALEIGGDLINNARIELVGCALPALGVGHHEHGLIVEHLLKVRHAPFAIGAVSVESKPDMVVHAPCPHCIECCTNHAEQTLVVVGMSTTQEQQEVVRRWELGSCREAAVHIIVHASVMINDGCHHRFGHVATEIGRCLLCESGCDLARCFLHASVVEHPNFFQPREEIEKAEAIAKGVTREVRAGKERTSLSVHHNRQWPPAMSGKCLTHIHTHRINIRTFFAIDLDTDEVFIEICSNGLVFEGLALHYMTPVTCRIAHAHKHRLVLGTCTCERFVTPRIPIHRIVCVLQEIWRLFESETIRVRVIRHRHVRWSGSNTHQTHAACRSPASIPNHDVPLHHRHLHTRNR